MPEETTSEGESETEELSTPEETTSEGETETSGTETTDATARPNGGSEEPEAAPEDEIEEETIPE